MLVFFTCSPIKVFSCTMYHCLSLDFVSMDIIAPKGIPPGILKITRNSIDFGNSTAISSMAPRPGYCEFEKSFRVISERNPEEPCIMLYKAVKRLKF